MTNTPPLRPRMIIGELDNRGNIVASPEFRQQFLLPVARQSDSTAEIVNNITNETTVVTDPFSVAPRRGGGSTFFVARRR